MVSWGKAAREAHSDHAPHPSRLEKAQPVGRSVSSEEYKGLGEIFKDSEATERDMSWLPPASPCATCFGERAHHHLWGGAGPRLRPC